MKIGKVILHFAGACLLFFTTCKKEVTKIDEYSSFGRSYDIKGNQNILGVIRSPDNGYLIWGYTDQNSSNLRDGFVLKLDKNYEQVWYKTLGGVGDDYITSAAFDDEGNIMAGGISNSFGVSVDITSTIPNSLIYAIYLNSKGGLIWEKTYGGNEGKKNYDNSLSKVLFLPNKNFALIGSTQNYPKIIGGISSFVFNAYIQCIDKRGNKIWNSNYNYNDTVAPNPVGYFGSNALLTKDGNILMMMVSSSGQNSDFPTSVLKISPASSSGTNKYIWLKPIKDIFFNFMGTAPFRGYNRFPMLEPEGSGKDFLLSFERIAFAWNEDNGIINYLEPNDGLIQSMEVHKNNAYFLFYNVLSKTDLKGKEIWTTTFYKEVIIKNITGIFVQDDNSISSFCSYVNAKGDSDIALIRFNENGGLILK